ncbi:MAG: hypothetical protein JWN12_796 [Candidatus Saccharibacteria bacterium]|nr:hypothetical protein [Candidatus Saccharibacteria bacterium]
MAIEPSKHHQAFEAYMKIRRRTSAKERLKKLHAQCVSYRANLHDISEQQANRRPRKLDSDQLVRSMMKMRSRLNEALQETQALESSLENYTSISVEMVQKEFARLCANPYLLRLSVTKDQTLQLIIGARYEFAGIIYDLGDWSIEIGHQSLKQDMHVGYNVYERRSGVVPNWNSHAPVYRLGDHKFCLGDNFDIVEGYLQERDYLAAIEVITFSLCNINDEDILDVPNAFKQVA